MRQTENLAKLAGFILIIFTYGDIYKRIAENPERCLF
jgi:hypothetical protein